MSALQEGRRRHAKPSPQPHHILRSISLDLRHYRGHSVLVLSIYNACPAYVQPSFSIRMSLLSVTLPSLFPPRLFGFSGEWSVSS